MSSHADHPRVSGEHSWCWSLPSNPDGSSPRERGARLIERETLNRERIIPA